jgi:hypothetical protein
MTGSAKQSSRNANVELDCFVARAPRNDGSVTRYRFFALSSTPGASPLVNSILGIEEPLTDAINYVQALYLMGHGLISHHEAGGDAIVALAQETGQRLESVKEIWNEMLGEKRRFRSPKRRRA